MIIDGKKVAEKVLEEVSEEIGRSKNPPKLCVFLIGSNPASLSYVGRKEKACEKVGMNYECVALDENVSESELLEWIGKKNADSTIDGIIVQLPLPQHIDRKKVVEAVSPEKDVDGFTISNAGKCFLGRDDGFLSCTPKGIMRLLSEHGIDPKGKNATVIGYGDLVGKPLTVMLSNAGATVTACHSLTRDLSEHTKNADVVVVAAGVPGLLKSGMVKPGAVVIDVGINRVNGRIVGDADFEELEKTCAITPVPGGVGPMTVAMLLENTLASWKRRVSAHNGTET